MDLREQAIEYVIENEGGYADHPNDPGGETKYGITSRDYPDLDIKGLTKEGAAEIYRQDYWRDFYEKIEPPKLAVKIFDFAVNMGHSRAHRLLQKALIGIGEPVAVDGVIGQETLEAVVRVDGAELTDMLICEAMNFYDGLIENNPALGIFRDGWFNRARRMPEVEKEKQEVPAVLDSIKNVFSVVQQVLAIYTMVITVTELDPDCQESQEKLGKAKEWLDERLNKLEERGALPSWARRIFFGDTFSEWVISVLVKAAHELGFFERAGD